MLALLRRTSPRSVVAHAGVDVLRRFTSDAMPIAFTPRLDLRAAAPLAVTLASGPVVGLLPALRARRPDLSAAMNTGSKGAGSSGRQRTRSTLVIAEVALTVILLASAGLLLRSLARAAAADPGFEPARVLAFDLSLPDVSYTSREKRLLFTTELLTRLRALPGVDGAGTGMAIPFSGGGYGEYVRRPGAGASEAVTGRMDFVSPGYLEALGTRLLAGRRLTDADNRADAPRVAVISRTRCGRCSPPRRDRTAARHRRQHVAGVPACRRHRRSPAGRPAPGVWLRAERVQHEQHFDRSDAARSSEPRGERRDDRPLDAGVAVAAPRTSTARWPSHGAAEGRAGVVGTFAIAAASVAGSTAS